MRVFGENLMGELAEEGGTHLPIDLRNVLEACSQHLLQVGMEAVSCSRSVESVAASTSDLDS